MKKFLNWRTTYNYYATAMDFWISVRDRLDISTIEIRYEDTIDDLPSQARIILDHLGLEWEEEVLTFYKKTQQKFVNTPSFHAVRKNVHRRAVDRWKNYPGPTSEALPSLRPYIEGFGYNLDGQPEK